MNKRKKTPSINVGIAPQGDPKKQNRGITLLALVITIIVLLILGTIVTKVAIDSGPLKTARSAHDKYIIKSEKAEITIGYHNYQESKDLKKNPTLKVKSPTLKKDGQDGPTAEGVLAHVGGDEISGWTIYFTDTKHTYSLDGNGNITGPFDGEDPGSAEETNSTDTNDTNTTPVEEEPEVSPDDLTKYLLGPQLQGRPITEIMNENGTAFIDKDGEGSIERASTKVKFLNEYYYQCDGTTDNGTVMAVYVKYNNVAYKVMTKGLTYTTKGLTYTTDPTKGVQEVYKPKAGSKEGTIVKYSADGSGTKTDWLVLYDNGSTLDIMSVDTMGNLTLGVKDVATAGSTDLEKAIYSYNNAVSRLNNYCNTLVTNSTAQKVRSVGAKFDVTDTLETYSSDKTSNWQTTYNGRGKLGDTNAEEDIIRMSFYDKADSSYGYAKSNAAYWLASRIVDEYSGYVRFNVRYVISDGYASGRSYLWYVYSSDTRGYSDSYAVRPVVRVATNAVS